MDYVDEIETIFAEAQSTNFTEYANRTGGLPAQGQ
jgi:hypothetical protein